MPIEKQKAWRSQSYLDFVRSRPCCVTYHEGATVAHHVRMFGHGGVGLKPSDYLCVPLDAHQHALLHQMGEKAFWKHHGVDPVNVICMTMLIWLAKNPSPDLMASLGRIVSM